MPTRPTEDRMLNAGRQPPARMPGEFLASTVLCCAAIWYVVHEGIDFAPVKYVLYLLLIPSLAAPTAALVILYAVVAVRRVGARLTVRRARNDFRVVLRAARRHPELADLGKLRAAALALGRLAPADARLAAAEISAAAQHPYLPIRRAAQLVLDAQGGPRKQAPLEPPLQ